MKFRFDSVYDRRHMASLLHAVNYLGWAAKPNTKKLWTLGRKYAPLVTIAGAAVFLIATVTVQNIAAMLAGIVIFAVGRSVNRIKLIFFFGRQIGKADKVFLIAFHISVCIARFAFQRFFAKAVKSATYLKLGTSWFIQGVHLLSQPRKRVIG